MAGHVHGELKPAPDAQLVKGVAQIVLHYLFGGAKRPANFTIGQAFPYQNCHLHFFRGQPFTRLHRMLCSLRNMAVASFTRFRPSRIPARRKSVRRCCLTVRGLMFSWPAISLLLQPCTSRLSTCWS